MRCICNSTKIVYRNSSKWHLLNALEARGGLVWCEDEEVDLRKINIKQALFDIRTNNSNEFPILNGLLLCDFCSCHRFQICDECELVLL